ncbi:MAG: RNA methyltransferase, partial [Actinomycetota bacterium]|nr:RNA methyltransferase [Actinomycetota bacterium]
MLEGPRALRDALASGAPIEEIFVGPDTDVLSMEPPSQVVITEVGPRVINALTDSVTPQGIVAVVAMPDIPRERVAACDLVLVLDGVADPGNA